MKLFFVSLLGVKCSLRGYAPEGTGGSGETNSSGETSIADISDEVVPPKVKPPKCQPVNSVFGEVGYKLHSMTLGAEIPTIVGQSDSCAQDCAETAGCYTFNVEESKCELVIKSKWWEDSQTDWSGNEETWKMCSDSTSFKEEFVKVSQVKCTFRAPDWTPESLRSEFLNANGLNTNTPIDQWIITKQNKKSTSQIINMLVEIWNAETFEVLTDFKILTWIRTPEKSRRRRSAISEKDFSIDAKMIESLQTELNLPRKVKFIETLSITEKVIVTKGGEEIGECSTEECTCFNGAVKDATGVCVVESCQLETIEKNIERVFENVNRVLDNTEDIDRVERNKRSNNMRMLKAVQTRKRRKCAETTQTSLDIGGPLCNFEAFVDYSNINVAMQTLCRALAQYNRDIHEKCRDTPNGAAKRVGRLDKRCAMLNLLEN